MVVSEQNVQATAAARDCQFGSLRPLAIRQSPAVRDDLPTCHHFSQNNPVGSGQDDVPALLRRVADTIESLGAVSVQDIVFHTEVTADGSWHGLTVYLHDGNIYAEDRREQ